MIGPCKSKYINPLKTGQRFNQISKTKRRELDYFSIKRDYNLIVQKIHFNTAHCTEANLHTEIPMNYKNDQECGYSSYCIP